MLFTTFWLSAGWLRYPGPPWWQAVTIALAVVSAAGLIAHGVGRLKSTRSNSRNVIWLAGPMVLLQAAAVLAYYFGVLPSGAQGRYLFPVLPAVFCLIWLGWSNIAGADRRQSVAAVSLISVMALLSFTAWTLVILPAYA